MILSLHDDLVILSGLFIPLSVAVLARGVSGYRGKGKECAAPGKVTDPGENGEGDGKEVRRAIASGTGQWR